MTREEKESRIALCEELRVMHKEMRWLCGHMEKIYDLMRSEDSAPLEKENPNQLNLFNQKKGETNE